MQIRFDANDIVHRRLLTFAVDCDIVDLDYLAECADRDRFEVINACAESLRHINGNLHREWFRCWEELARSSASGR